MPSEIELQLIAPPERIERAGEGGAAGPGAASGAGGASFPRDLRRALESVDQLQVDADRQADAVARGAGNLHEVALAFEKADVALRLASRVRNKLIDTYNEIMRMSV
jgi:flagellar hook-basal body complex protein FliE